MSIPETLRRAPATPEQLASQRIHLLQNIHARDILATKVNGGNIIEINSESKTVFYSNAEKQQNPNDNGKFFVNGYLDTISGIGIFVNSIRVVKTMRKIDNNYEDYEETQLILGIGYAPEKIQEITPNGLQEKVLSPQERAEKAAVMARMRIGEVGCCVGNLIEDGVEEVFYFDDYYYKDKYHQKLYSSFYTFAQMQELAKEKIQEFVDNKDHLFVEFEGLLIQEQRLRRQFLPLPQVNENRLPLIGQHTSEDDEELAA